LCPQRASLLSQVFASDARAAQQKSGAVRKTGPRRRCYNNKSAEDSLMEGLFALLDHALLVKEVLCELLLEVRDLFAVQ